MASSASANTPLLPVTRDCTRKPKWKLTCCVGSKAARLVLLWNFAVLLAYRLLYNSDVVMQVGHTTIALIVYAIVLTFIAVFSPVAGLLTDIRFSRYRAVVYSSWFIIITVLYVMLVGIFLLAGYYSFLAHSNRFAFIAPFLSVPVVFITIYVIFIINALQFGMDQLHDSPTEDSIMFIHWYVWIYYTCTLITEIPWNLSTYDTYRFSLNILQISGLFIYIFVIATILSLIIFSLCVVHYRKAWFLLEPAGVNPYKLVYKVTKFVYKHKVPVRRSAFTYCTEELPSRMDVGKHKYGGPFTTKQVEDVKAFWGILKVILSIGPAFLLQTVMQSILPTFAKHGNVFLLEDNSSAKHEIHLEGVARYILISNGLLSPLLVVICIPLYLCCIRPHIRYHVPGMLKRIGLAIVVMVLSLTGTIVMDIVVHLRGTENSDCMFNGYSSKPMIVANNFPAHPLYQNVYFFTSQHVLSAVANMLLDIAVLEFICSQSPYSMKGLLLGIFFSVKFFFQGITFTFIFLFGTLWNIRPLHCGSGFYLMNIIIGLLELVLYTCASKRYKYREVNEPSNEYRYAENYYSNT